VAARFALVSFVFHNSVTGADEHVEQGASRDSVTSQAFLQTPASFWSAAPLSAASGQIHGRLAQYLAAYPNT
jgi:hypothetical protein